jgi:hypothetical protein
MAKRFTDSTKWNDDWFFNLKNEEKLAWIYILDTCDHAGIWKKNLRLLNFQVGSTFVEDDLKRIFSGKIFEINDKWFIPNFIKFQYGKTFLTSNTPAVKSARELLLDTGFIQVNDNGSLTVIKELSNPYLTLTEQLDKGYETVKDKDKGKDEGVCTYINKEQGMNEEQNTYKNEEQKESTLKEYEKTMLKDVINSMSIPNDIKYDFVTMIEGDSTSTQRDRVFQYETTLNKVPGIKQFLETFK